MMRLKISMGKTINIGQYESLRVDIGQEFDVPAGTYIKELELARDILSHELRELEKFMRKKHGDRAIPER